jgi:hypothetical protein
MLYISWSCLCDLVDSFDSIQSSFFVDRWKGKVESRFHRAEKPEGELDGPNRASLFPDPCPLILLQIISLPRRTIEE